MTPAERETILRTDDASDTWTIWSAKGSRQARRLLKRCPPVAEDAMGYRFEVPLAWVRVAPPRQVRLTEAQRQRLSAHMKALRRSESPQT
jgi:hypothetical protein